MEIKAKCLSDKLTNYNLNYKYVLVVKTQKGFLSEPKIVVTGRGVATNIEYNNVEAFLADWTEIVNHTTKKPGKKK